MCSRGQLKNLIMLLIAMLLVVSCSSEVNRAPVVNLSGKGKSKTSKTQHYVAAPASRPLHRPLSRPTTCLVNKQKQVSLPPPQRPNTQPLASALRWQWPVQGPLLRRFHTDGKGKGIDIGGSMGLPVKAAAKGVVVYSGNALRGYGNLIIIKHDEDFLSAYAHNRELRVKEGECVHSGQEIATMGKTDAEQVKLHFEIRYKGKPVDPIPYLPKR